MLVIVGLILLPFAGVIAFVGVLSNAGVAHPLCGCVAVAQFTNNANATLNRNLPFICEYSYRAFVHEQKGWSAQNIHRLDDGPRYLPVLTAGGAIG